jgi:hypothetical protein
VAIQLIRLSQIRANLEGFMDFEQQLVSMFGEDDTERFVATPDQQTFILGKEYGVGKDAIKVFVNGILQIPGPTNGYIEVNGRMISFTEPLVENDVVVIVHNTFNRYSTLMGKDRAKAYDIFRQTYFITTDNATQTTFNSPAKFQRGLNQIKVYANGLLLACGASFDYIEYSENEIQLMKPLDVGTTLTIEVITGGLRVFKCERYPYFVDSSKANQTEFILPSTYRVGSNQLKVYLNGQLLRKGSTDDYLEVSNNTVKMNYEVSVGSILEFEITTFTVDVFTITRKSVVVTSTMLTQPTFTTIVPYTMGESNLRVYLNGVLLREGGTEDYTEVDDTHFKIYYSQLKLGNVIEYEIISW